MNVRGDTAAFSDRTDFPHDWTRFERLGTRLTSAFRD